MNPFEQESSFFIYDIDKLSKRCEELASAIKAPDKLLYAVKANSLSSILKCLKENSLDFDFASEGELFQVERTGAELSSCLSTGPAKTRQYLKILKDRGCGTFVLESLNQLKWLNEISTKIPSKALLRLQLEWGDNDTSVLGGDQITAFGLGHADWASISLSSYPHVDVRGVHCFQWGNILDKDRLEKIWDRIAHEARQLSQALNFPLEVLDVGGGLGIDYSGDQSLSFSDVTNLISQMKRRHEIPQIWLELGRYLVADCGKFYSRVIDKKFVRGKDILVLNSGINALLRPALTNESFPAQNYNQEKTEHKKTYQIHGPLCTALDCLGNISLSSSTEIGDWIEFNKVGAYGFSESMPFFLGHPIPGEYVSENSKITQIRAPMPPQEYLK